MKPIGTIIYHQERLQMIIAYYPIEKDTNKRYDYLTCLYPVGFSHDLPSYFVNDEDCQYIVHEGLETDGYEQFVDEVKRHIAKMENQQSNQPEIDLSKFSQL